MRRIGDIISSTLVQCRDALMYSDRGPIAIGRWPVRSSNCHSKLNPFFVLGHPRSGTTLLRALLCNHSDVFIPPENGGLWKMVRVFGSLRGQSWENVVIGVLTEFARGYEFDLWNINLEDLSNEALQLAPEQRSLGNLIGLIYRKYGAVHAPGKNVWGDKTTPGSFSYLGKLSRVFPHSAYVHIVRDGRDCVASSIKAGFFDKSYSVAAQAWVDNVRGCRKFGQRCESNGRFLELRYEDLIRMPAEIVRSLCDFLGLEYESSMLDHHCGLAEPTTGLARKRPSRKRGKADFQWVSRQMEEGDPC